MFPPKALGAVITLCLLFTRAVSMHEEVQRNIHFCLQRYIVKNWMATAYR
jgi:hypothetical protein